MGSLERRNDHIVSRETTIGLINTLADIYPEEEIDWTFVIANIKTRSIRGRAAYNEDVSRITIIGGQEALELQIPRVLSFAKNARINPSDPPIVYAFGWFITESLSRQAYNLEFLDQRPDDVGKLRAIAQQLQPGLKTYAEKHLRSYGEDADYDERLKILQTLLFMNPREFDDKNTRFKELFSAPRPKSIPIRT